MGKPIYELEMAKEETGNNILIVDALNLAFRYKHAKKTDFADLYVSTVKSFAKSYSAKHIIIACDWGKSTYRKDLYPEYKGDREAKVALQTEEERDEFEAFFEEFEKAMAICEKTFLLLRYKGVEADDISAYICREYCDIDEDINIWLISSDKDWDLLLTDKVHRFSFVTRKEYTKENFYTHYPYPLDVALDIKVLVGGKDNVTGIAGVGEARALKLIEEHGTAFDIYDSLPIPGKAKYIQNTNEFGENILRNIQLIDKKSYCKEAIGLDNVEQLNSSLRKYLCF